MARLIDADALRLMMVEECAGHSIEYALGWKACIEYIKAVPTIDAIPVEWMIDRANDPERAPLYRRYAQMLYEEWQKEQEAR